jgi:hypothetical protein
VAAHADQGNAPQDAAGLPVSTPVEPVPVLEASLAPVGSLPGPGCQDRDGGQSAGQANESSLQHPAPLYLGIHTSLLCGLAVVSPV